MNKKLFLLLSVLSSFCNVRSMNPCRDRDIYPHLRSECDNLLNLKADIRHERQCHYKRMNQYADQCQNGEFTWFDRWFKSSYVADCQILAENLETSKKNLLEHYDKKDDLKQSIRDRAKEIRQQNSSAKKTFFEGKKFSGDISPNSWVAPLEEVKRILSDKNL